jgi:drug/metabolite transporter (DMT)-like permease
MLTSPGRRYAFATLAGVLAILLWASNIAFSKAIMERLGNTQTAFYIYFFSGIFVFGLLLGFDRKSSVFSRLKKLPLSYHLKAGVFFILNNMLLFMAVGVANSNEELVIVTLLNYTWPILVYIVGIPMHRLRIPAKILIPGIFLSISGLTLALFQGYNMENITDIVQAGNKNILAYGLAFFCALSWAIYSNLTVKHDSGDDLAAIPVVLFLSGLVFLGILAGKGELDTLHFRDVLRNPELIYMIIGPTSLGYLGWFFAVKYGNRNLVTSLSFFIPLMSLTVTHLRMQIAIGATFWIATLLIISGSYLCYRSFRPSSPLT